MVDGSSHFRQVFIQPPASHFSKAAIDGWLLGISSVQTQLGRRSEQVHLGRVDLDLDGIADLRESTRCLLYTSDAADEL